MLFLYVYIQTDAPTQVSITAMSTSVQEDSEMSFHCITNGGNPLPKLRINKQPPPPGGSLTAASQDINAAEAVIPVRLTRSDNGFLFFCTATSSDTSVLDYDTSSTTSVTADVRCKYYQLDIVLNIFSKLA